MLRRRGDVVIDTSALDAPPSEFERTPISLFDTIKYSLHLDHMSTTHLICNFITVASGVFFAINQYTDLQPEVIRKVLENGQDDICDFPSCLGVM